MDLQELQWLGAEWLRKGTKGRQAVLDTAMNTEYKTKTREIS
jgi:hypothetical protein